MAAPLGRDQSERQTPARLEQATRDRQARLDQFIHVTRSQFEAEFGAYRDIWKALDGYRSALLSLRPSMGTAPLNETREARDAALQKRYNRLTTAFNAFREAVDGNSPFYDEQVFTVLSDLMGVGNRELLQVQTSTDEERFSNDWYDEGESNRDELRAKADEAARTIRNRIAKLAIIP